MATPNKKLQPDVAALLARAAACHRRGELDAAEALYREVLAAAPAHFDALHLCGVLMQQRGRSAEALRLIGEALSANAEVAPAHANYGLVLAALGRPDEALANYDRALALKPDYAEAHYNRANALALLGREEEALAGFDRAIALRSDYAAALLNRAQILQKRGRLADALEGYDRAFALARPSADALIRRGNVHYDMKSFVAALADYDSAGALRPDAAPVHNNRGNTLRELARHEEALAALDRAVALKPEYAEAYNNRGNARLDLNRPTDALADYDRALALKPDYIDALVNRGSALRHLERFGEAVASLDRAIALAPDLADAYWNRALAHLSSGAFAAGWQDYEWRWRRKSGDLTPRAFSQPQWRGEDIRGKTILLHAEQGFGDTIQFVRYAPMVASRGGKVLLEIPDDLAPLAATMDGVAAIVSRGQSLPPFDLHCPLLSLPLAFGTTRDTVPATVPYLTAPAERVATWRARLSVTDAPRVGLVWSGKPAHKNDHNRSIPLALLKRLLATPGVRFISLQKEIREGDDSALREYSHLTRLDGALTDFADTAAAIACLDLVIAVDTAVAHLAGAMGKPVWILLPAFGDWRWLNGRDDTPWYPTARLFRRPASGGWDSVIARIADELDIVARTWRSATA
jgi:tetratricopeptide (TPR) repeat protein